MHHAEPHDDSDMADWPDALAAYRAAYALARRNAVGTGATPADRVDARRELARLRRRARPRGLDTEAEARVRAAIGWGQADGRAGAGWRW